MPYLNVRDNDETGNQAYALSFKGEFFIDDSYRLQYLPGSQSSQSGILVSETLIISQATS